jgi:hypothetical protein
VRAHFSQNTFSSFDFPAAKPTDQHFSIDMSAAFIRSGSTNAEAEPEPYLGLFVYSTTHTLSCQ